MGVGSNVRCNKMLGICFARLDFDLDCGRPADSEAEELSISAKTCRHFDFRDLEILRHHRDDFI